MKQHKKTFRHESLQDSKSIAQIINALNQGISEGTLSFSDEDDEIMLNPKGLLRLQVTASQDEDKQSFSLKVSWQTQNAKLNKKNKLKVTTQLPL